MPRFLVPIDFSPISINAALYAVQMAESMPKKEVILFNTTEEIHAGVDGTPIEFDGDALVASNLVSLENLQVNLFEMGLSPMDIVAEIGELPEQIKPAIQKYNIDMVVMGMAGANASEESFFGTNAVEISKNNTCPVMVVPPEAMFKGSGKIAVTVDYKDVENSVFLGPLKKWLDILQPELHFIFVSEANQKELTAEQAAEKAKLEKMASGYNVVFSMLPSGNFSKVVNKYVEDNSIDQIVIFPKKYGFFEGLFNASHTEKMLYHSHVPVISIHGQTQ